MDLKLKRLCIKDFAGISNEIFNLDGIDTRIYGANATGKTTTATALQWLLFDKGLDGSTKSFNPVPVSENNEERYELIPTVIAEFMIDDKELTIRKESHPKYIMNQKTNRKEYSRSRTKKQYINDESLKVKDFKAKVAEIIDEDVFKLVTNIYAFNQLDWKDRRKLLFDIADPIDDSDVIKTNSDFKDLQSILGEHDIDTKKKIIEDKIRQINKDITDTPVRINQTENNKQDIPKYDYERYTAVKQEIEELGNKRVEIQNGGAEVELRNQLADKKAELKRIEESNELDNDNKIHALTNEFNVEEGTITNHKSKIKYNKQQIEHEEKRRKALLEKHKDLQSDLERARNHKFEYSSGDVCSCCGQSLPSDQVEAAREKALKQFNHDKSKELEVIQASIDDVIADGKKIKPIIEKLESENNDIQIKINESDEKAKRIQNKINKLKSDNVDVTQTKEYKNVLNEINDINAKRKNIRATIDDDLVKIDSQIDELNKEKSEIESAISIENSNKHLDETIKELRQLEDKLLDEKEEHARSLYVLKEYTRTKINMLTENINNKFKIAEFKLFNQFKNGDLEETCVTTVDGVEFDGGLNNAGRINVGLDIINTLSNHYNITAPIFIDNAESITEIIDTKAQQIQLVVSEKDKNLRMETI